MGVVDPKIECADLGWSWSVHLLPSARYRELQKHLPGLLGSLEQQGFTEVRSDLDEQTRNLGIDWAWRNRRGLAGDVYMHVRPPARTTGGFVSGDTEPLVEWIEEFLTSERASNKRHKLGDSDADELHLFVIVPVLTGAVDHRVWHPRGRRRSTSRRARRTYLNH